MNTITAGTDPTWILAAAVVAVLLIGGYFAYRAHKKGTPNSQLPAQVLLQADDAARALEAHFLIWAQKHNFLQGVKFPGLKSSYWDRDDFMQDVGVLKQDPTNISTVNLDDAPVKSGTDPVEISYYTQPNNNITKDKPQTGKGLAGQTATA